MTACPFKAGDWVRVVTGGPHLRNKRGRVASVAESNAIGPRAVDVGALVTVPIDGTPYALPPSWLTPALPPKARKR